MFHNLEPHYVHYVIIVQQHFFNQKTHKKQPPRPRRDRKLFWERKPSSWTNSRKKLSILESFTNIDIKLILIPAGGSPSMKWRPFPSWRHPCFPLQERPWKGSSWSALRARFLGGCTLFYLRSAKPSLEGIMGAVPGGYTTLNEADIRDVGEAM